MSNATKNAVLGLMFGLSIPLLLGIARADGVSATGNTLPIGTSAGTVLTITGGGTSGDASFTGTLETAGQASVNSLAVTNGGSFGGNVGIGTTTPTYLLDVDGGSSTTSAGTATARVASTTSGLTYLDVQNFNQSTSNNGSILRLITENAAGNNLTSFDIVKYANGSTSLINWDQSSAANIAFLVGGSGTYGGTVGVGGPSGNEVGSEKMRITASGNVGIGTTNPSDMLHVYDANPARADAHGAVLRLESQNENWGQTGVDIVNPLGIWGIYTDDKSLAGGSQNGVLSFWSSSFGNVLNLTPAGNVGIGTATPSGTLDVENSSGTAQLCLNGKCVTNLIDGTTTAAQQKLQTTVQNDVTSDLSNVSMSCPSGKMMTGISNGQPVCATPPTPTTVTAASIVGGVYTQNLDGSCRYANPNTGGCGCPSGQNPMQIFDFVNSTCADGFYADGSRTSNCGIISYLCLASN